jgi:uncharacterized protein (TIGR02444 family)
VTRPASPSAGSPFWRFSLRFYRQPEVADACITLQEQAGVDVNLLLFLLWHAVHKRALSTPEISELEARIAPWRNTTVVPLRTMRRALKSPSALVGGATAELFRTKIKAAELEAERLQQEAMHELAVPSLLGKDAASLEAAAHANMTAYAALRGAPFPSSPSETLLAALARLERNPEK